MTVPVSPRWPACSSTSRWPWSFQTSPGRPWDKIGHVGNCEPYMGGSISGGTPKKDGLMENPQQEWMITRYSHFRKPPHGYPGTYLLPCGVKHAESLMRMVTNFKRVAAANKTLTATRKPHEHSWWVSSARVTSNNVWRASHCEFPVFFLCFVDSLSWWLDRQHLHILQKMYLFNYIYIYTHIFSEHFAPSIFVLHVRTRVWMGHPNSTKSCH